MMTTQQPVAWRYKVSPTQGDWYYSFEQPSHVDKALTQPLYLQADQPPSVVRHALLVLLGHVEPGWENCKWIVQAWLDGKLTDA